MLKTSTHALFTPSYFSKDSTFMLLLNPYSQREEHS